MSEVLTLGFAESGGAVVSFQPDFPDPNGRRLF
jgi:tRNA-binding protein